MRIVNIKVRQPDGLMLSRSELCDHEAVLECNSDTLDSDHELFSSILDDIEGIDLFIVQVSGDLCLFRGWREIKSSAEIAGVPILVAFNNRDRSMPFRDLFDGTDKDWKLLLDYITIGGMTNTDGIIKWCLNRYEGFSYELEPPCPLPAQGYYYPGSDIIDIEKALDFVDDSRPVIGVLLSQRKWASGKLEHIDCIIRSIESAGATALPLFITYKRNETISSIGIEGVIYNHLLRDGKPIVDCIINTISSSVTVEAGVSPGEIEGGFMDVLGVPVLQSPVLVSSEREWRDSFKGLTNAEVAYSAAFPEFDGQIIAVPCASSETDPNGIRQYLPIKERVDRVVEMAMLWASLRRKRNNEKRIAIIFYMYPPKNSHAGCASDLDTFESIKVLMKRLFSEGYSLDWVPETSQELVDRIFSGITNDLEMIPDSDMRSRAYDMIDMELYNQWFQELSEREREHICRDWGDPPGEVLSSNGCIAVPGIRDGNIFLSFQPSRGKDIQASYHNHNCSIPHQYHSFYKWLRRCFGADAVIHVGTHGTLEWLPGKAVALSNECSPDYVLDAIPNIYPYIIGNPGEGTQAKRRSYAVLIDHMIPSMVRAGGYDDVDELEGIVQSYMKTAYAGRREQLDSIAQELYSKVLDMNLLDDLNLGPDASVQDVESLVDELYDYVVEFKSNLIKDGFHVLGKVPEGPRLVEMIYSLTRLRNGDVPSLPASIAGWKGYGWDAIRDESSSIDPGTERLNGEIVEEVESATMELLTAMASYNFNLELSLDVASDMFPGHNSDMDDVIKLICNSIYPNILRMGDEIESIITALNV